MQANHTNFDQLNGRRNETSDHTLTFNLITRQVEPERHSAFLAERGQITTDLQINPGHFAGSSARHTDS